MTVIFHDIHKGDKSDTQQHRVATANFDEVLFADDTICVSESAKALTRLLRNIETEGAKYGLKLNYDKCEVIRISRAEPLTKEDTIYFKNGKTVKNKQEAKYLGCWLNDKGDPEREVKQRIANCMTVLKKLDIYWREANPSISQKINVHDAIIRSKLLYGLESTAMSDTVKRKLDTFQLKGLRKILNIKTTYVDRSKDNMTVMQTARLHIAHDKPSKQYKTYSEIYEERKIQYLNKIILAEEGDSMKSLTFQPETITRVQFQMRPGVKRRIGKPRTKWVETTMDNLWNLIGKTTRPELRGAIMNLNKKEHVEAIKEAARQNVCNENHQETTNQTGTQSCSNRRMKPHELMFTAADAGLHVR